MKLRDYQVAMVDAIIKDWQEVNSTLVVSPTGSGKTVMFADVVKRCLPKRAMVVAHREELIWQARDKIERYTGQPCEIEMAELTASTNLFSRAPVTVATVQTLNSLMGDRKRMSKFAPSDFGVLVVDEGHHAVADSYRNVIGYFTQNKDLRVLGVTATPDRADEEALGQVFQRVSYDYEILDAIHDGWLVPVEQQMVAITGLDFSHIHTTAGDLNGAELAQVMEAEKNLHGVASASLQIVDQRRAIVFTASVAQAEALCNIFNRHRPGMAAWVCGFTKKEQRRDMLSQFAAGKIQVVVNCGVLTEGFDDAGVEVIVMARPTKSRCLYSQMCGRSMRTVPGLVDDIDEAEDRREAIAQSAKPCCLIVDFVGNSGKHKLITSADILGGKVSDDAIQRAVARMQQSNKPERVAEILDEEERNIQDEVLKRKLAEEARRHKVVVQAEFKVKFVNPFGILDISPQRARGWDNGRVLSPKQRALLMRQGINPDSMPYVQSRQLINELFRRWNGGLCSLAQANVIKRFYPNMNTKELKRDNASKVLDLLARNHWKANRV